MVTSGHNRKKSKFSKVKELLSLTIQNNVMDYIEYMMEKGLPRN